MKNFLPELFERSVKSKMRFLGSKGLMDSGLYAKDSSTAILRSMPKCSFGEIIIEPCVRKRRDYGVIPRISICLICDISLAGYLIGWVLGNGIICAKSTRFNESGR